MTKVTFHNKEFQIKGLSVPEFVLSNGKLVRIYVPNFNKEGLPLGFDLTIYLIKLFIFLEKREEFDMVKTLNELEGIAELNFQPKFCFD